MGPTWYQKVAVGQSHLGVQSFLVRRTIHTIPTTGNERDNLMPQARPLMRSAKNHECIPKKFNFCLFILLYVRRHNCTMIILRI